MRGVWIVALLSLTACMDRSFTPREKVAEYDAGRGTLTLPHPCPDWSQPQTQNYQNALHSNFGCAVNRNLAVQLETHQDLVRGKGETSPDSEVTTGVIGAYRAGKIPEPLTPLQGTGSTQ